MRQAEGRRGDIAIIGAGTYGPVIADLAETCGYNVSCYLDDNPTSWGTPLDGVAVEGPVWDILAELPPECAVAVAIGSNEVRLGWLLAAERYGHKTPPLISPHAVVSPKATIGEAVYLHPGSHVWTHASLGRGTILSPHATIAHHTSLGDACFVSTGANVGASISVGRHTMFGIGSTTSTGVKIIAHHTLVGAGAVIIRDTEEFGVYVGSPARLIKFSPAPLSRELSGEGIPPLGDQL